MPKLTCPWLLVWCLTAAAASSLFNVDSMCPHKCVCRSVPSTDSTESLKATCGTPNEPINSLQEIDFSQLVPLLINLNLSGNIITSLSTNLSFPFLQKLDLSRNNISMIEPDTFSELKSLQKLDLSNNLIKHIFKDVFTGLDSLYRLILSHNKISTISNDTFDRLPALTQLDISNNLLKCDCDILWMVNWSQNKKLKLIGNPRCVFPESLNEHSIKKLKTDTFKCESINVLPNALILQPQNSQVVFEGDSLILKCKAPFSTIKTIYNLTWSLPNNIDEISYISISDVNILEEGLAESILTIAKLLGNHSGVYTCTYYEHNFTKLFENISIVVISNITKYCPMTVTSNNKGLYTWPGSISGNLVSQPCYNKEGALAYYNCSEDGYWSQLNTSACSYASQRTKMLEQFALLKFAVVKGNVLSASQSIYNLLLNSTPPMGILDDPDDINFIVGALSNYLQYANIEEGLGSTLLDVVNIMMSLPQSILMAAENMYNSCSSITNIVEQLSPHISNIEGQKNNLAIERFSIKRETFNGMTCTWYSKPALSSQTENEPNRMLLCSTSNVTIPLLADRDKIIEASIQIPKTLLHRIEQSFYGAGSQHSYNLVVTMYEKSSFFPRLPAIKTENTSNSGVNEVNGDLYGGNPKNKFSKLAITTPIVGIKLANITLLNPLVEPIYIFVPDLAISLGVGDRAVLWDEETKMWSDSSEGCSILRYSVTNTVVIQCRKLGYVGLMQSVETSMYEGRSGGARFRFSHPAVYVGSSILLVCLLASILTYTLCYSEIHMTARAKHSLINTWLALSLLCFLYTLGIYQTEDIQLCQAIGLLIHYLTLSCLLWITVTVSQLYKNLSKSQNQPLQSPDDELPPEVPIQKPILGIYLVGWGIALIVCGISGAVNMKDYASHSHCFLSNAPALSAVFVPAVIIVLFISILFLLIRCTIRNVNGQLSEGTQATENVDLEMWEPSLLVNNQIDRQSEHSTVESEVEDTEHTPIVQLRALVIVLFIYLLTWFCGIVAVYCPFSFYTPYKEDIFSVLYAVFAIILGIFILFFYGIARSDVRSQWLLMQCYLKKRKKCCRTRSVFDANAQNVASTHALAPISNAVAAQTRSRSSSQNSNRTNSKSNNSNILKAAAEFNSHTLPDSLSNGNKVSNMNLVVLHRQQYRSNNSVVTFPESGANCAEIFYNPNQSNVARKFFKKQRKNVRRNCLDIPRRHNFDTDSQVSSVPLPSIENMDGVSNIFTSSSKVNNTNIHVEKGQLSDNGLKESRNQSNPNILSDNEDNSDKPQLKRYIIEKEPLKQQNKRDKINDKKVSNQNPVIVNIYTNIPETKVPQHQVVSSAQLKIRQENAEHDNKIGSSISAEEFNCKGSVENLPTMRTVSQQCSLEYSSTSEVATPLNQLGSDKTLNTHSELTSLQETHSALCSAHEIASDTDDAPSFAKYIDFSKSNKGIENSKQHTSCSKLQQECDNSKYDRKSINRSLQDINSKSQTEVNNSRLHINDNIGASESDHLFFKEKPNKKFKSSKQSGECQSSCHQSNKSDCEINNMGGSEQLFDNESDIYFPNYQMSEVSIRSHGLYAPPSKLCVNDIGLDLSNGELSQNQQDDDCYENQYVNYNPAWKKSNYDTRFYRSPAVSCPDVNHFDNDSPTSLVSEIDELYKQITIKDRRSKKYSHSAHGSRHHNDRAIRHCESDSCISESHSDILESDQKAETRV
ncbi:remoulade [Arctopsyche grandis]|uniref:remoulade n=1 Tax=Arctopsyche grandis TaxID=121162 RepID=UPI00406D65EE